MTNFQKIVGLYVAFAAFAIAMNLGAQMLVFRLLGENFPYVLYLALIVGTGVALVTKYFLDKTWIFKDYSNQISHHARRFVGYSFTGVITTALFWGTELAFDALTEDGRFRYLGGGIGLALGYALKFWLDSKFVFRKTHSETMH